MAIGLILDLGLGSSNKAKSPSFKDSLYRTLFWVSLGVLFCIPLYYLHPYLHELNTAQDYLDYKTAYGGNLQLFEDINRTRHEFAMQSVIQYITGYFVEYSLSVDNLFVMMLIFGSFKVAVPDQKRILVWGVIGAVLMRFLFIFLGGVLISHFHAVLYVFGAFLLFTGIKMLISKDDSDGFDAENHPVIRWSSKYLRVTKQNPEGKFFLKQHGKTYVTGLFVVLLIIEFTDVVFAVDSVPAIFGITRDPYLVFFSNIFAIMGLRSLFFLLGHSLKKMSTLKYGLSLILIFIGAKMIFQKQLDALGFEEVHSLLVLASILVLTYVSSFLLPRKTI